MTAWRICVALAVPGEALIFACSGWAQTLGIALVAAALPFCVVGYWRADVWRVAATACGESDAPEGR